MAPVSQLGPLVGRGGELAAVTEALRGLDRSARFIALSGEPGIGKTRLLHELSWLAQEQDCLVLTGRGAELERDLPFGIWVDALDDHVDRLGPERLERMLGDRVAELARVLPAVTVTDPRSAPALQDERYRAHRAVRALLERIAAARSVVITLDDLQWADDSSLELVAHLLRRPPRAPLLVAAAFRAGGLGTSVLAAFEAAARDGRVLDLRLAPLSPDEAGMLLGDGVSAHSRAQLYRMSGGNPFYLEQLAQTRPAAGSDGGPAPDGGIPRAVAAALAQEIAALSEPARRLAQGAAVAGDPAELTLAATAGGVAEPELLPLLDELVAARLLAPTELPRRYRFRHPIVRRVIYEAAGAGWRLGAHARAAAALEHGDGSLAARAHHLERCARPGDGAAVAVLVQAGHAVAPSAPAEAARWYAAALGLLDGDDAQRRLELLVALATALAATGRLEPALATLDELLTLVPRELAELRARLIAACAGCENLLGRHGAARERLEQARAQLPDSAVAAAAALEAELAADALFDSDFAALTARAARARASAAALAEPGLLALTAALDCFAHYGEGRLVDAAAAAAVAAATLDRMSDAALAARLEAPYYLGFAEYLCERFEAADRHLRRGIAVSRATGQGQFVVPMLVGLAHALEVRGQLAEALDTVEGAVEAARLSDNRQVLSWALVGEGWVAATSGDPERAARAADEAVRLAGTLAPSILTQATQALGAVVFLEAGDVERCFEQARAAGAPDFASIEPGRAAWMLSVLARAELERGRPAAAAEHAARAHLVLERLALPLTESAIVHVDALLALGVGEADRAARLARTAAELADSVGAAVHGARMRALCGRALAQAGDRDAAVELLSRAEGELTAIGARRLRDEAARELRRLGVRVSARQRRGTGEGLEALSGREREIAELVALGRTNREIAAELFLSAKTVEGHLTNVFGKLGVGSRAAVAEAVGRARGPAVRPDGRVGFSA